MPITNLNYKHLRYFWIVAKEGSITRACEILHLTPQTISGQLSLLEQNLGIKLFSKSGRNLEITEDGLKVFKYADEIFQLGTELEDTIHRNSMGPAPMFLTGIADAVPKLIAYRILEPALKLTEPVRLVCHEEKIENLLADLAIHKLDLVLADAPISPKLSIRAFNHLLGECGTTFFASKSLLKKTKTTFPKILNELPLLMPTRNSAMSNDLDAWLDHHLIRANVSAEFDDSALMKVFGQAGAGIFIAPTTIEKEVIRQHQVKIIGRAEDLLYRFYAISVDRRLKHPAVIAISETARNEIFIDF